MLSCGKSEPWKKLSRIVSSSDLALIESVLNAQIEIALFISGAPISAPFDLSLPFITATFKRNLRETDREFQFFSDFNIYISFSRSLTSKSIFLFNVPLTGGTKNNDLSNNTDNVARVYFFGTQIAQVSTFLSPYFFH